MAMPLFPDDPPSSIYEQPGKPRKEDDPAAPLADRMRPRLLEEVVGQTHLIGPGKVLSELMGAGQTPSMILWGPPGVGKTTIARLAADRSQAHFVALSAVLSGVKEVRRIVEQTRRFRDAQGRSTLLFIDEIHRFNKAQQDAFLPHVEKGLLTLIGATTENPSFEVIAPLLSRCRVFVLKLLGEADLRRLLKRALDDCERGLGSWNLECEEGVLERLAGSADGDARQALSSLETAARLARSISPKQPRITLELLKQALQSRHLRYDKSGEEHYNLISALHKSMRNSDADASLYWVVRMLESGEDPRFILRRMIRFAAEDVGLADPNAVARAVAAANSFDRVGLPEGKLFLAQLAVDLARSPKSNEVYRAYAKAAEDVKTSRNDPVPLHLRNAPTGLMKDLGYGRGYRSAHDEGAPVGEMDCMPEALKGRRYFQDDPEKRQPRRPK